MTFFFFSTVKLVALAVNFVLVRSIINSPDLSSQQTEQQRQQEVLWTNSIKRAIQPSSRLAEFATAIWNLHCNPKEPTHQHLLFLPHQKCTAPFPNLVPVLPLHDTAEFSWSTRLKNQWRVVEEELNNFLRDTRMDNHCNSKDRANEDADIETNWKSSKTNLCDDTRGFTKLTIRDEEGKPTTVGSSYFPCTLKLLESTVGSSNLAPRPVNINCQAPGTGLACTYEIPVVRMIWVLLVVRTLLATSLTFCAILFSPVYGISPLGQYKFSIDLPFRSQDSFTRRLYFPC